MKTILCFGDSNTNGCNPKSDIRDWVEKSPDNPPQRYERHIRWTGVLQQILGPEYYVIEEGMPGRTFVYDDAVIPHACGADYIRPCMASHMPLDLLVVMLGTNDAKHIYGSYEYPFMLGMEEFLKIAKDPALWMKDQKPNILLIAPPPIGDAIETSIYYGLFNQGSVALSKKFAEIYEKVAKAQGCHYLNAGAYVKSDPADSIHFSVEDHRKLAEGIAEKIKEIL